MAENRKITIEIVETQKETKQKSETANEEGDYLSLRDLWNPGKAIEKMTLGKSVFINQAYSQAKNIVSSALTTGLNQYFKLNEDYIAQNSYNNLMTSVSKTKSLVSTALAGAQFGPGGLVAAGVGWAITEVISYRAKLSNYYSSLNSTNYNTEFSRTRAGLVDNGRGTEN